jgi:hypothetical protein
MGFRRGAHDGETVQVFITMQQGYPKILKKKRRSKMFSKKKRRDPKMRRP